jgi:hypothetical protein
MARLPPGGVPVALAEMDAQIGANLTAGAPVRSQYLRYWLLVSAERTTI